jgi:hypothetical protein
LAVLRFTAISNFVGKLHREIARLFAAQDTIDISGGATSDVYLVDSVGGQTAGSTANEVRSDALLDYPSRGSGLGITYPTDLSASKACVEALMETRR